MFVGVGAARVRDMFRQARENVSGLPSAVPPPASPGVLRFLCALSHIPSPASALIMQHDMWGGPHVQGL